MQATQMSMAGHSRPNAQTDAQNAIKIIDAIFAKRNAHFGQSADAHNIAKCAVVQARTWHNLTQVAA